MIDDAKLLPPRSVIHDLLAQNQRQRHRLRAMLRLLSHAEADRCERKPKSPATHAPEPAGEVAR